MSKKIVIEVSPEIAEALVLATGTGAIVDQIVPQLQGKVERSVIEWHKTTDRLPKSIKNSDLLLVRWKDKISNRFHYLVSSNFDIYGSQHWAHLPEGSEDAD